MDKNPVPHSKMPVSPGILDCLLSSRSSVRIRQGALWLEGIQQKLSPFFIPKRGVKRFPLAGFGRCDLDAFLGHNLDDLVHVIPARLADHDVTTEIAIRRWRMNRTGFH